MLQALGLAVVPLAVTLDRRRWLRYAGRPPARASSAHARDLAVSGTRGRHPVGPHAVDPQCHQCSDCRCSRGSDRCLQARESTRSALGSGSNRRASGWPRVLMVWAWSRRLGPGESARAPGVFDWWRRRSFSRSATWRSGVSGFDPRIEFYPLVSRLLSSAGYNSKPGPDRQGRAWPTREPIFPTICWERLAQRGPLRQHRSAPRLAAARLPPRGPCPRPGELAELPARVGSDPARLSSMARQPRCRGDPAPGRDSRQPRRGHPQRRRCRRISRSSAAGRTPTRNGSSRFTVRRNTIHGFGSIDFGGDDPDRPFARRRLTIEIRARTDLSRDGTNSNE